MNHSGSSASRAAQPSIRSGSRFSLAQGRVKTSAARRVHKCGFSIQVSTTSRRPGSSMRQRDATLARLSATAQPSRSGRRSVTKPQTLASGAIPFRAENPPRDDLEVPHRFAPQAPAKVKRLILREIAERFLDRGVHAWQRDAPMVPARFLVALFLLRPLGAAKGSQGLQQPSVSGVDDCGGHDTGNASVSDEQSLNAKLSRRPRPILIVVRGPPRSPTFRSRERVARHAG